jgi:hypothetical protein
MLFRRKNAEEGKPGRRRGERGQALVEFSLVAIIFFMMVFGIIDMARLFQSWVTVQHAAREGARYAITGQSVCDGAANRDACIEWTSKRATSGLTGGGEDATDEEIGVTFKAWDYVSSNWTGPTSNKTGKACDQIEVKGHVHARGGRADHQGLRARGYHD